MINVYKVLEAHAAGNAAQASKLGDLLGQVSPMMASVGCDLRDADKLPGEHHHGAVFAIEDEHGTTLVGKCICHTEDLPHPLYSISLTEAGNRDSIREFALFADEGGDEGFRLIDFAGAN
jgi:hypothetical protein